MPKSSINRLLKEFIDTGTVDRRQGSGGLQSSHTDENIDQMNDMILSQEDRWLEFTVLENDEQPKKWRWKMQDWKMAGNITGMEFAWLENDILEFVRLENVGQENARLQQYDLTLRCLEYILLTASSLL